MILFRFTSGSILNLEYLELVTPVADNCWVYSLNSGERLTLTEGVTPDYQDYNRLLKEWEEAADYISGIE